MILDRMKDVEEVEETEAEVSSTFSKAIEKRQQIKGRLKSLLDSNNDCIEKLRSMAMNDAVLSQ